MGDVRPNTVAFPVRSGSLRALVSPDQPAARLDHLSTPVTSPLLSHHERPNKEPFHELLEPSHLGVPVGLVGQPRAARLAVIAERLAVFLPVVAERLDCAVTFLEAPLARFCTRLDAPVARPLTSSAEP